MWVFTCAWMKWVTVLVIRAIGSCTSWFQVQGPYGAKLSSWSVDVRIQGPGLQEGLRDCRATGDAPAVHTEVGQVTCRSVVQTLPWQVATPPSHAYIVHTTETDLTRLPFLVLSVSVVWTKWRQVNTVGDRKFRNCFVISKCGVNRVLWLSSSFQFATKPRPCLQPWLDKTV